MSRSIPAYLISRISLDAHERNEAAVDALGEGFDIFIPHQHNPYNLDPVKMPRAVVEKDLSEMKHASFALLVPPYGRDCAWEIGWFAGRGRPVIAYVTTESGLEWLRDWMVKSDLQIATPHKRLFDRLCDDPILNGRVHLVGEKSLGDIVRGLL